ncbi:bacteriohopanetetrol glucosamine biosynthesis glycosyltransferase HpnI [Salinisphaera sp.]|uniref:bacteriohopanetetrol glucosamine biosynthesis glycosyltransferase HpnI n=1 Tax=Salinisphaera sp. TaxID=1914330 RepID=UPI002D776B49|nr:bacteriohopanetetrol glucosamine biosynthesis glycosyltransferase HpnI [Salinisphaera sp.]HET7314951.1 bacteriohopanetetrol glucosamine biosynthesis glycosyltransferase HpnI [Salinisphaera sp.]
MINASEVFHTVGFAAVSLACGYSLLALLAVCLGPKKRPRDIASPNAPPVTVLKPLCGAEAELERCLRSFCDQDYSEFQIVFGIQDGDDPALAVARRVRDAYPGHDIEIVVDTRQWGTNRKVSNLINMMTAARHDRLVLADSDILVGRDYLARVTAPLADPGVGLATCLYRGWAGPGLWSRLGALFIDDWFMPSVLISHRLGNDEFVSGATIAVRRETLDAIGGFGAVADRVADDHALGECVRGLGLQVAVCDYVVSTWVYNSGPATLVDQETRWMRTIHSLQPLSYDLLFVTLALPLIAISLVLDWRQAPVLALIGLTVIARAALHGVQNVRAGRRSWHNLAGLPLREALTAYSWLLGLAVRRVRWRGRRYWIADDGSLKHVAPRD